MPLGKKRVEFRRFITCLNVNCNAPNRPQKIEKPVTTAEFLILYPFSFIFVLQEFGQHKAKKAKLAKQHPKKLYCQELKKVL